ncbi:MAG: CDP-diacylglycerol--glycerol-3-phosphate 3-phosphatidyltransferase [Parasporobacterium sp.]|nr:CDP-diacylglycerol--glycerol-3-phosphate 3-phosphatidyltransferase [Parasporobacterium sp.]
MNLPNKLTIMRLVFIPFYMFFELTSFFPWSSHLAVLIFAAACLTDAFDGKIARKRNLVTDFGKFADPLADKILVVAAMICAVSLDRMPGWVCVIIIAREFAVSGFRLVCATKGTVIAASKWGKFKTCFQMAMCILMSLDISTFVFADTVFVSVYTIITNVIMYIALALTIISMIDYFYKNRKGFSINA